MRCEWSRIAGTSTLVAVVLLAACKNRNTNTAMAGESAATPPAATTTPSPTDTTASAGSMSTSNAKWSDANIVALLDEANEADSAAGAYALTKATAADVKSFAKLMMGEHHALRAQGQALAKKLNVTPEKPSNDPLPNAASDEMNALKSTPKGAQFDKTYIDKEVGIHQAVIDLANNAYNQAQNAQLKDLIQKAKPILQKHLDRAKEIQGKLGSAT